MNIIQHNQFCEDTIHASIRMNKTEYLALREYMHAKPKEDIWFPYGTTIIKHGYGWYYMSPTTSKRAIEKMAFALKTIKAFLADAEDQVESEIKRLMPTMLQPGLQVASFSTAHCAGEFGYLGSRHSVEAPVVKHTPVASIGNLQRLATRFEKRRHV